MEGLTFNPKTTALKIALKKMFEDNHFSICTIDKCLTLTGCVPNGEVYRIMSTVHCCNFKDMEPPFRQWLFEHTILMFAKPEFDFNKFELLDKSTAKLYLS